MQKRKFNNKTKPMRCEMSLQQQMREFSQERRNKERLLAWRFKIDCLKRNNGHLVPSIFTDENSKVRGVRLVK